MREIDLKTWYRTDFFLFYKSFQSSLFNITTEVDVSDAYAFCKEINISFFIFCLYVFLKAANEVPQFRHRLIDDKVFDMEQLDATTPIMIPNDENHQFTMIRCIYQSTFSEFNKIVAEQIKNASSGIAPDNDKADQRDLICLNCVPWFHFTGGAHACISPHGTIPLLNWGKFKEENNQKIMPYFLQASHMFVDGYHVGVLAQKVADYFAHPESV